MSSSSAVFALPRSPTEVDVVARPVVSVDVSVTCASPWAASSYSHTDYLSQMLIVSGDVSEDLRDSVVLWLTGAPDPCFLQVKSLNSGTFGFVELALDKLTGQQLAIKFIERGEKVG